MEEKVLSIVNRIRVSKGLTTLQSLDASSNLRNDLGLTSFDLAELTVHIEDEFEIEVPDDEIENIKTVGELVAYIEGNQ